MQQGERGMDMARGRTRMCDESVREGERMRVWASSVRGRHRTPYLEDGDGLCGAGHHDAAPAPKDLAQDVGRPLVHEEAAQARGDAKHLVEADGDKVGLIPAQVEPVRRDEGGGIEQHAPVALLPADVARLLDALDPVQRIFDAAEVVLRGEGEQVVRLGSAAGTGAAASASEAAAAAAAATGCGGGGGHDGVIHAVRLPKLRGGGGALRVLAAAGGAERGLRVVGVHLGLLERAKVAPVVQAELPDPQHRVVRLRVWACPRVWEREGGFHA